MIKSIKIKIKNKEPIIIIKGKKGDNYKWETHYGLYYPFRVIKRWNMNKSIKNDLLRRGHKPYKCEGCGDGWAEYAIDDPNELKQIKKIFVCIHCVEFYDWKWSRKKIYNDVIDFRDNFEVLIFEKQ